MKSTLFLRVASVLTFLHAALHTIGGVFGKVPPGPATIAVEAMKLNQFLAFGATRTYWDFYHGMGLAVSIFLTFEAVIFWQLASLAKNDAVRLRPIIATLLFAYVALSVNSGFYFFIAPVITELLIAACLVAALVTARTPAPECSDTRSHVTVTN